VDVEMNENVVKDDSEVFVEVEDSEVVEG
jgi:hypothetical protein